MPDKIASFGNQVASESSTAGNKLSETMTQVKDKMSDVGRTAVDKIDENRSAAATGLDKAASAIHQTAESLPGGEKVSGLAHAAADKLSSTAGYVRAHDVNRMMADVETLVKNSPGPSLLAAAAIGFLVGRAFSSND
jgi:ElaB/YqjD/DUF883 family membrane-anchored ribosome-binding protein